MVLSKHITAITCGVALSLSTVQAGATVRIPVGGSVRGVTPVRIVCVNQTTGQCVTIRNGRRSWNCEATGLQVEPGDAVLMAAYTTVDEAANAVITLTSVPPWGSLQNLQGCVQNVIPTAYKIAVYIRVRGGWWTKPFWSTPLTSIRADGNWECDITTGGVDQEATEIVAYLVVNGYNPPLMSGGATLPEELDANSVARAHVTRTP